MPHSRVENYIQCRPPSSDSLRSCVRSGSKIPKKSVSHTSRCGLRNISRLRRSDNGVQLPFRVLTSDGTCIVPAAITG